MSVDFRCENCGKLLTGVEAEPGGTVKCPHCHKKIAVPAGLASLPRPQIAANGADAVPAPPPDAPIASLQAVIVEDEREQVMMSIMARFMPWLISVFFHVGLAMIMLFMVMIAAKATVVLPNEATGEVIIPDAEWSDTPGGRINPGSGNPDIEMRQSNQRTEDRGWATRQGPGMSIDTGSTGKAIDIIGGGGGGSEGGVLAAYGMATAGGSGAGPRSNFFGSGGNAHHVVFVVDRSGSMVTEGVFDAVKAEIVTSIGNLRQFQGFHVILFSAEDQPMENPPRQMVFANKDNKRAAAEFMEPILAEGKTDPIPALRRAFEVLKANTLPGKGKLIYLLTDGVFPDNEAVLNALKEKKAQQPDVLINTYLYGQEPPEAVKVMKQIASDFGGKYKYIQPQ